MWEFSSIGNCIGDNVSRLYDTNIDGFKCDTICIYWYQNEGKRIILAAWVGKVMQSQRNDVHHENFYTFPHLTILKSVTFTFNLLMWAKL